MSAGTDELRSAIAEHEWYHTIEIAPGLETPGWFDTRSAVDAVGFPRSLAGKRCLDIGTFDGFWALEMERRGADEVVAIDLTTSKDFDWPAGSDDEVVAAFDRRKADGTGFDLVTRVLGSNIDRRELSVYDLTPEFGQFDFVYFGSLLLHLRDPVRALTAAASVCRGEILVVDAIDLPLTKLFPNQPVATLDGVGRPWWWRPNAAGLARMIEAAGFEIISGPDPFTMKYGRETRPPMPPKKKLLSWRGIEGAIHARRGDPHAAVRAKPC